MISYKELEDIFRCDCGLKNIYDGLTILRQYNPKANICYARQGEIYLGDAYQYLDLGLTKQDAITLRNYGWDLEEGNFIMYI